MTLKKTWTECLRMWKWIVEQKPTSVDEVWRLKEKWLIDNGYDPESIYDKCFFCDYDENYSGDCNTCPAVKVDKDFHCENFEYHFVYCPKKFYKKIVRLYNKKYGTRRRYNI